MRRTAFALLFSYLVGSFLPLAAQTKPSGPGDGKEVTAPKSLDSVRFKNFRQELTFSDVERLWPNVAREEIVRQMGTVRHSGATDFLYRVAIVDTALYKGKLPEGYTLGEFAISSLIRTGHPSVPEKLDAVLRAPMEHVRLEERRKIKNRAARVLLRFKGTSRSLIYKTLDDSAKDGVVACPFPPPSAFRRPNGTWIDPPVEEAGRDLMQKWLDGLSGIPRLETALCMAESGVADPRLLGLAKDAMGTAPGPRGQSPDERFLAEQILKALSAHGDSEAEKADYRVEMEKEIKRLSTGHPEGDRDIREHFEREFRKKWNK